MLILCPDLLISASFLRKARSEEDMVRLCWVRRHWDWAVNVLTRQPTCQIVRAAHQGSHGSGGENCKLKTADRSSVTFRISFLTEYWLPALPLLHYWGATTHNPHVAVQQLVLDEGVVHPDDVHLISPPTPSSSCQARPGPRRAPRSDQHFSLATSLFQGYQGRPPSNYLHTTSTFNQYNKTRLSLK